MVKSRNEILKINPIFTHHLLRIQKEKFKPDNDWQIGDTAVLFGDNDTTVLTKEISVQLNKEDDSYYAANKDQFEIDTEYTWIAEHKLISAETSSEKYLADMANSFTKLSQQYGDLIMLGDWNTPWSLHLNNNKKAIEATSYFFKSIDKSFNEGFQLNKDEINEFIPHLFWLTRCYPELPQFHIGFSNANTIFSLSRYGILHLEFYNALEQTEMLQFFSDINYKEVDSCVEPIKFDSKI